MPLLLPRVRQIKLKRRIRMHYAVGQGRKYNPLRFDHPTRFVRALVTINIDGRTTAKRRILGRSGNWPRQSEAWNAGRIWPRTSHQFLLFFYVCSVIFLSSLPFRFYGGSEIAFSKMQGRMLEKSGYGKDTGRFIGSALK